MHSVAAQMQSLRVAPPPTQLPQQTPIPTPIQPPPQQPVQQQACPAAPLQQCPPGPLYDSIRAQVDALIAKDLSSARDVLINAYFSAGSYAEQGNKMIGVLGDEKKQHKSHIAQAEEQFVAAASIASLRDQETIAWREEMDPFFYTAEEFAKERADRRTTLLNYAKQQREDAFTKVEARDFTAREKFTHAFLSLRRTRIKRDALRSIQKEFALLERVKEEEKQRAIAFKQEQEQQLLIHQQQRQTHQQLLIHARASMANALHPPTSPSRSRRLTQTANALHPPKRKRSMQPQIEDADSDNDSDCEDLTRSAAADDADLHAPGNNYERDGFLASDSD